MVPLLNEIDSLLRGRFTAREALVAGRIELPARRLLLATLLLGVGYGACMGLFGALRGGGDGALQLIASMVKVPLLFLLTLAVTFPSLYVSSALADSRLEVVATLRLLLASIGVDLALLASLGPVVAFFTLCTESYPFMVLLNVLCFAVAGVVGVTMLRRAIGIVLEPAARKAAPATSGEILEAAAAGDGGAVNADAASATGSSADGGEESEAEERAFRGARRPRRAEAPRLIFTAWIGMLAIVGAQLGWVLRPFIGSPGLPFTWLRPRQSNFFAACCEALGQLFQ